MGTAFISAPRPSIFPTISLLARPFLGRTDIFFFLQLAGIFPDLLDIGFKAFPGAPGNAVGGGCGGACSSSEIIHGTTLLLWHQSKDAWVRGRGGYSHRHRAVRSLLCADKTRAVFKYVYSSKSPLHDDSVRSPEDFRCRVKWSHPLDSGLLEEATECAAPVPCPCGYSRSPMM